MSEPERALSSECKVFLCHSKKDISLAKRITSDLESRGAKVWVDVRDLGPGKWKQAAKETIEECDYVVIALTRSAVASQGVKEEIDVAVDALNRGKVKVVIPVLIEDCTIPKQLQDLTYISYDTHDIGILRIAQALGISTEPTHIEDIPLPRPELVAWMKKTLMLSAAFIAATVILLMQLKWLSVFIALGVSGLVLIKLMWARHIFHYPSKEHRGIRHGRRRARWYHHISYEYFGSTTGDRRGTAYPLSGASISLIPMVCFALLSLLPTYSPRISLISVTVVLVGFVFLEWIVFPRAIGMDGPHMVPFYASCVIGAEICTLFLLSPLLSREAGELLVSWPELKWATLAFPILSLTGCIVGYLSTVFYMRNIDNELAKDALNNSIILTGIITTFLGVVIVIRAWYLGNATL